MLLEYSLIHFLGKNFSLFAIWFAETVSTLIEYGTSLTRLNTTILPVSPHNADLTPISPINTASSISVLEHRWEEHLCITFSSMERTLQCILSRTMFSKRLPTPDRYLWPKLSTRTSLEVSSGRFTPSDTATITALCLARLSRISSRNLSIEKFPSGRYIKWGAVSPLALKMQVDAVNQPAWRPIISIIVTLSILYTELSLMISWTVVVTYLTAEPKPGVWSVQHKSLSIVFGIPITLISMLFSIIYLDSFSTVSMESFPPI